MRAHIKVTFVLLLVGLAALLTAACGESDKSARKESVSFRDQNFARAEAKYPLPAQQNFPLRGLLKEFTERQDMVNHPWWTYITGENGNVVSFLVSTTVPLNVCAFLSSTEDVRSSSYGNLVLTAPSLDGIFYGGSGASSVCNGWIVKDTSTNAMGIIYDGGRLIVWDQPLLLEAEPVRLQPVPPPSQRKQP